MGTKLNVWDPDDLASKIHELSAEIDRLTSEYQRLQGLSINVAFETERFGSTDESLIVSRAYSAEALEVKRERRVRSIEREKLLVQLVRARALRSSVSNRPT